MSEQNTNSNGFEADGTLANGEDANGRVTAAGTEGADTAGLSEQAESQRALEEQRDKYLRLAAEFDNFRRRSSRERQEAGSRAQGELISGMLEALDDLSRFAHIDPATVDAPTVVQGVDMVERKLLKALTGFGLEVIDPLDRPFDPNFHEAINTEPALSPEDDHLVSRVFQVGYLFNGQLLRPARVTVKQWNS